MPADASLNWTCRWSRVDLTGAAPTLVWICEYPYRTMLLEPPAPGACGPCPLRRRTSHAPSPAGPAPAHHVRSA